MAHLLLIDDDDEIIATLQELLRVKGHVVHTASTGEEGLQVLRSGSLPDALVLDVDMPVLDGPGMAHKMLLHDAGEQNVPIILMSGNRELPAIAERMGTPYFLAKPCGVAPFLTLLNRVLTERHAPSSA